MTSSPERPLAVALPALAPPRAAGPVDGPWAPPPLAAGAGASWAAGAEDAAAAAYARGVRDGEARAGEALRAPIEALLRLAEHFQDLRTQVRRDAERDLEAVAIAIAQRLVQRELTAHPDQVRLLVERALELLPHETAIEIRMHPGDLERLAGQLESTAAAAGTVRWIPDPAIERGGFVAEGPRRVVDGRADVALRALYERLGED
jgi:flagellar biosynthesis/type III secretory pathway protein FliH